jgi:hypothetical protein
MVGQLELDGISGECSKSERIWNGYGLEFVGQYDEETKLMNMISRDWQVDFFKTDQTDWYVTF